MNTDTVKLGNKEHLDKEQIGIKELLMDYSHLSNKRGAWNKRGGVPKMENHQM